MTVWLALGGLALICAAGVAAQFPVTATVLWIFTIEATPDLWFSGAHETMIGIEKGAGVMLVVLLGMRLGWRWGRYNPGFAFGAMFSTGLLHGLYPGLTMLSSLRSLIGSAGPFAFGFIKITPVLRRAVVRSVVLGPLVNIAVGMVLNILHRHAIATMDGGAFRLTGAGLPAFLGGFALIAIYAGLMQMLSPEPKQGGFVEPLFLIMIFGIFAAYRRPHAAGAGNDSDLGRATVSSGG